MPRIQLRKRGLKEPTGHAAVVWGEALHELRAIRERDLLLEAIIDAINEFEEHGLHATECECTYCNGIARLYQAYEKVTGQR